LQLARQTGVSESSVICMLWNPKINQIVVGCGDGVAKLYYDPKLSKNGALLSMTRKARVKDPFDFELAREIITPYALPMFQDQPLKRRKMTKDRFNPKRNVKPEETMPSQEVGKGHHGKIATTVSQILLKQYIHKDTKHDEDPREALLKYAAADENPVFFKVFENQPKILDYSEKEVDSSVVSVPKPKEK